MYARNVKNLTRSLHTAGPSRLFHSIPPSADAAVAQKRRVRSEEDSDTSTVPPRPSPPSRPKRTPRPKPTGEDLITADIVTGQVISRAASKRHSSEWKHTVVKNGLQRRLEASLETKKTTPRISSAEKNQFFMLEDSITDIDVTSDPWSNASIVPGTFVELRRCFNSNFSCFLSDCCPTCFF